MHDTDATIITSRRSSSDAGRRVAQLVYLFVYVGVFLDVKVALGQICFRLVVIVVRHEVLDRVVREEVLELLVKLCGQGLVMGQHQGRALGAARSPRP